MACDDLKMHSMQPCDVQFVVERENCLYRQHTQTVHEHLFRSEEVRLLAKFPVNSQY